MTDATPPEDGAVDATPTGTTPGAPVSVEAGALAPRHDAMISAERSHVELSPGSPAQSLHEWAQSMHAAAQLARSLVHTPFAPAAFRPGVTIKERGRERERTEAEAVAAAAAAIMAGASVGLNPLQSLSAYHIIEGEARPAAITQRAAVLSVGGDIEVIESTPDRAAVRGRRRGGAWQTSTWDVARARAMGLTERRQWKTQPQAMLVARATAEVARWIAADKLLGIEYTPDELEESAAPPDEPATSSERSRPRGVMEIIGDGSATQTTGGES